MSLVIFRMRYIMFAVFLMLLPADICQSQPAQLASCDDIIVVGYLMTGNTAKVNDDMAQGLTDIIYFSVEPSADGSVDTDRIKQSHIDHLNSLRDKHSIRIHLAVGGWGRCKYFAAVSLNDTSRAKFVAELKKLCLEYKFDGIDFDWEFPKGKKEEQAYNNLIIETAHMIHPEGKIVTCALSPWQKLSEKAYVALDRVHIMAYDQGKRHSTYEKAVESVVTFIAQGIDRDKLCLGVPFYGRKMSDTSKYMAYNEIVDKFQPGYDADEAGDFFFNGPATIKKKTSYCVEHKLAGVMIWEISHDTSDDSSLLRAINKVRRNNIPQADAK